MQYLNSFRFAIASLSIYISCLFIACVQAEEEGGLTNSVQVTPDNPARLVHSDARNNNGNLKFAQDAKKITVSNISAWLKDVPLKIRRRGILPEEAETYYQVLGYARDVDTNRIKEAANRFLKDRWKQSKSQKRPFEKFPVYVDIYQHPELYQGRPVIMSGHVQRTVKSNASENDFGIETICEAWLYTEDSQLNPTVVVSTSFPEGFPIGEQAIDHVTVTGYIYRMYTYDARDTRRFAPLLIAHEIKWTPISDAAQKSSQLWGMMILLSGILTLGILLGIVFLMVHRKKERSRKNVASMLEEISPPTFEIENDRKS